VLKYVVLIKAGSLKSFDHPEDSSLDTSGVVETPVLGEFAKCSLWSAQVDPGNGQQSNGNSHLAGLLEWRDRI